MTIAPVSYIRQYQVNSGQIEESKISSWYGADNSLYLNNTKRFSFAALLSYVNSKHEISNALDC